MTRELTDKQVQACENAVGKTCHCRCGGAFHGRAAGGTQADGTIDRAYFESLPSDDPHKMLTAEEQATAKQKAKRVKWLKKNIATDRRYDLHVSAAILEAELTELEAS